MSEPSSSSTQLRALEGERQHWRDCDYIVSSMEKFDELLAIAKDLEADRDEAVKACKELDGFWQKSTTEANSLRTQNDTLKRRLDEAMKALTQIKNLNRGEPIGALADETLTRITEIDKL